MNIGIKLNADDARLLVEIQSALGRKQGRPVTVADTIRIALRDLARVNSVALAKWPVAAE